MPASPNDDHARDAFGQAAGSHTADAGPHAWTPVPWENFAADLAASHPHLRVTGFIKHGGMGAVYKAATTDTKGTIKHLAIKMLRPDFLWDDRFITRFREESAILTKLNDPGIVKVTEIGVTPQGWHFFVMNYCAGETLAKYTQSHRLPLEEMLDLMAKICGSVAHVHQQGKLHRDLKPSNIIITTDAKGNVVPVIVDFGIARDLASTAPRVTRTNQLPHTPGYLAPEVEDGSDPDARSDVFALGIIFYELLTGQLPKAAYRPPSHYVREPRLDPIITKAISQHPNDRYPTATAFAEAMNETTKCGNFDKANTRKCSVCETLLSINARACINCGEDQLRHFPLQGWWQRRCGECKRPMSRFSKKCHHLDCLSVNRWAAFQTAPATALFMITGIPFFALYYSTPSVTNPWLAGLMLTSFLYRSIFYAGDYFTSN